jgi:flagellar hook assembly protein FlgD
VTIYNSNGTVILKLYKNFTLATQGLLEWDGKNEASETNPPGIYLIYAELFNAKGVVKKFRKTVVLAKKLN